LQRLVNFSRRALLHGVSKYHVLHAQPVWTSPEYWFVQATMQAAPETFRTRGMVQSTTTSVLLPVSLNKPFTDTAVPVHSVMEYTGNRGTTALTFNLNTRFRRVVSLTLRPHYLQGKSPRYSHNRRLGWPQNWLVCFREKTNTLHLPGAERRIVQFVV
jgi:hypothetical protein